MTENSTEKSKNSRLSWLFLLLLLLGLVFGCIGIYLILHQPVADYPQLEFDLNAERIDVDEDTTASGEEVMIVAGQSATVYVNSGTADIYYVNPVSNQSNTQIALQVGDKIVAESGLLEPGYGLTELTDVHTDGLEYGQTDGCLIIYTYDRETGQRSIIDNEIPLTVTVIS